VTTAGLSPDALQHQRDKLDEFYAHIADRAAETGDPMTAGFATFFDSFLIGIRNNQSALESLAQGAVGLGRFIVAQLIDGYAEAEQAKGVAALASGIWPPNPLAIKAASLHFLAAGLFKALAGHLSSAGRGGGNLAGSAAGSVGPSGASFQGGGDFQRPEMHIYINGEYLDPRNPRLLELVYMGQQFSSEVFAAGQVVPRTAHPRTPRTASPR
jgi:hypothetical protein